MKFIKVHTLLLCLLCLISAQMTFDECKRDCTLDWVDCVSGCDSIGNPQYCHQNCQKQVVHSCLDECPKIICIDNCRISLEQCRRNGKGICEMHFTECQQLCQDTYDLKEDI